MVLEPLDNYIQEINLNIKLTAYIKLKLKLSISLPVHVRIKNLNHLKKNREENHNDRGFSNSFFK